jgi:hypothetical protein
MCKLVVTHSSLMATSSPEVQVDVFKGASAILCPRSTYSRHAGPWFHLPTRKTQKRGLPTRRMQEDWWSHQVHSPGPAAGPLPSASWDLTLGSCHHSSPLFSLSLSLSFSPSISINILSLCVKTKAKQNKTKPKTKNQDWKQWLKLVIPTMQEVYKEGWRSEGSPEQKQNTLS